MLDINLSPDQLEHLLTQFLREIHGILEQVTVSCSIGAYRFVFPQEIKHLDSMLMVRLWLPIREEAHSRA